MNESRDRWRGAAALQAEDRFAHAQDDVRRSVMQELEAAQYANPNCQDLFCNASGVLWAYRQIEKPHLRNPISQRIDVASRNGAAQPLVYTLVQKNQ